MKISIKSASDKSTSNKENEKVYYLYESEKNACETDIELARELKINFNIYKEILLKFDAYLDQHNSLLYFYSKNDANKCIQYITDNIDSLVIISAMI